MTQTRIEVSIGYTVNMGNFESLRVDLGVEEDVRPDENPQQALDRVYSRLEDNLVQKVNQARELLKNGD